MTMESNRDDGMLDGMFEYLNIEAIKDSSDPLFQYSIMDDLAKSRHSRAGGNPESMSQFKKLDSRFHGNDRKKISGLFAISSTLHRSGLSSPDQDQSNQEESPHTQKSCPQRIS